MNYTRLRRLYINGENSFVEKQILECFRKFCYKSDPLPLLKGRTLKETNNKINDFFEKHFRGNLCFYDENVKGFAVFGEGQKWLDESIEEFKNEKVAVLIMGATHNESLPQAKLSLKILQESFKILKEIYNYSVVAWNQNRVNKRKPFERMLSTLGAKKIKTCYYV